MRSRPATGVSIALLVAVAATLGACGRSAIRAVAPGPSAPLSPCDTVSGTATNYGRTNTERRAAQQFRSNLPEQRGDLVASGLRRVRVIAKRTDCRPYRVFGTSTGLTTCTVAARICGR